MVRSFNVTGSCNPQLHYMVDIQSRLEKIKELVDAGAYFTINRAQQYGKTTTIYALANYLKKDYIVLSLDFQMIGSDEFESEHTFSLAFADYLRWTVNSKKEPILGLDKSIIDQMVDSAKMESTFSLYDMFSMLSDLCDTAEKPVVLIIDDADIAKNSHVFLDFLAQLRAYYLSRNSEPTFHSVVLVGVYDIKNIQRKPRPGEEYRVNGPWNIAADFQIDMSFSADDIAGMLNDYESDHHTGMDIRMMANEIYDYTSGYPFLVSKICKLLDEQVAGSDDFPDKSTAWTKKGLYAAVNILISENNTLFKSLMESMVDYPELKTILSGILFCGKGFPYVATNHVIDMATALGFVHNDRSLMKVSNRIFEMVLYNHLLWEDIVNSEMYNAALADRYRFIEEQHLNMKLVLEGFVEVLKKISAEKNEEFLEEQGRKFFMLYLTPIINDIGHCYVDARTRNMMRTDLVVEYLGEEFVVELNIWNKYHPDGEKQISEYLDYYNLKKGYMILFNSKSKEIGVREIRIDDKVLIEAVV